MVIGLVFSNCGKGLRVFDNRVSLPVERCSGMFPLFI